VCVFNKSSQCPPPIRGLLEKNLYLRKSSRTELLTKRKSIIFSFLFREGIASVHPRSPVLLTRIAHTSASSLFLARFLRIQSNEKINFLQGSWEFGFPWTSLRKYSYLQKEKKKKICFVPVEPTLSQKGDHRKKKFSFPTRTE